MMLGIFCFYMFMRFNIGTKEEGHGDAYNSEVCHEHWLFFNPSNAEATFVAQGCKDF